MKKITAVIGAVAAAAMIGGTAVFAAQPDPDMEAAETAREALAWPGRAHGSASTASSMAGITRTATGTASATTIRP